MAVATNHCHRASFTHDGTREAGIADDAVPPIELESPTVDLQMRFGETDIKEVRLKGPLASTARISVISIEPAGPEVSIVSDDGKRGPGVRLRATGNRVARSTGQITLATGLPGRGPLILLYALRVSGNLMVDPTNPFIDLRASPSPSVTIHISSTRDDFRLSRADVILGPFSARITSAPEASVVSVQIAVHPNGGGTDSRGFLGTLRVFSNDPAEPQKDVPIFALGQLPPSGPLTDAPLLCWRSPQTADF